MAYVTPGTVAAGDVATAAAWNVLTNDVIDLDSRFRVFTNEAARDAAITSPTEGMIAYLTAPTVPAATGTTTSIPTGIQTIYNGSVWVCVSQIGTSSLGTSGSFTTSYANVTISSAISSVTLVTGTTALVSYGGRIAGDGNFARLAVKSASVAATDAYAAFNQSTTQITVGRSFVMTGLTAGTNTFTLQAMSNAAGGNCDQVSLAVHGIA